MVIEVAPRRTMNAMRGSSIASQVIHTMKAFPQKGGIPAGSMDLTCSICQQEGGQHGS